MVDLRNRGDFLNTAALFEGGLVIVAVGLAWLAGLQPLEIIIWDPAGFAWGVLAAVPLAGLFLLFCRLPLRAFEVIRRLLLELLGPPLAACRWYHLLLLAAVVGFSEELLFRGVLQPWIERRWGDAAGLIGSNVLFGLAHAITLPYAVMAGLMGCLLGWLLDATGQRNLLVPMATHAVYDFFGFLVIAVMARREQSRQTAAAAGDEEPPLQPP